MSQIELSVVYHAVAYTCDGAYKTTLILAIGVLIKTTRRDVVALMAVSSVEKISVTCEYLWYDYHPMHGIGGIQFRNRWSTSLWRHNERDGVSNHLHLDCLLNHFLRHKSKKTSKIPVTGLCEGNSPVTDEFPAQMASNVENVSISWRHHV